MIMLTKICSVKDFLQERRKAMFQNTLEQNLTILAIVVLVLILENIFLIIKKKRELEIYNILPIFSLSCISLTPIYLRIFGIILLFGTTILIVQKNCSKFKLIINNALIIAFFVLIFLEIIEINKISLLFCAGTGIVLIYFLFIFYNNKKKDNLTNS